MEPPVVQVWFSGIASTENHMIYTWLLEILKQLKTEFFLEVFIAPVFLLFTQVQDSCKGKFSYCF